MRIPRKQKKALKKAIALKQGRDSAIKILQTLVLINMARMQAAMIQSQMEDPIVKTLQLATLGIDTARGLQNIYK